MFNDLAVFFCTRIPSTNTRQQKATEGNFFILTTFPIFYAICMGKHRIIIGNVAEGVLVVHVHGMNTDPGQCGFEVTEGA